MRVIHEINNKDVIESENLSELFWRTSYKKNKYDVKSNVTVTKIHENIVKVNVRLHVKSIKNKWIKMKIFFPERKYDLEYIKNSDVWSVDFLYEMHAPKEYFNLVILDQFDTLITSTTYVFDCVNIIQYPIIKKDYSEERATSKVIFAGDEISLITERLIEKGTGLIHTWQNVGQHYIYKQNDEKKTFITTMNRKDMCAGIWMLIVTDNENRLITQFLLNVN